MKRLGLGGYLKGQSQVLSSLVGTVAVWGLVIVGAVCGVLAFLRPAPGVPTVRIPDSTTGPEGTAVEFVRAWLRADRDHDAELKAYCPAGLDFHDIANVVGVKVSNTVAVAAKEVNPNAYWSVTVAAEWTVTDPTAPTTHFYQVPVARTSPAHTVDTGEEFVVVTCAPAEVAAPLGAQAPYLAGESLHRPASGDPVATTVGQFLNALLAGQGDLTRYVSPRLSVSAVRPAPYASVLVRQIATRNLPGGNQAVLAEAIGTTASGIAHVLQYPLEMAQRAGRWEVAKLLPAPSLSSEQPSLPAPTTVPPIPVTTNGTLTTSTTRPVVMTRPPT